MVAPTGRSVLEQECRVSTHARRLQELQVRQEIRGCAKSALCVCKPLEEGAAGCDFRMLTNKRKKVSASTAEMRRVLNSTFQFVRPANLVI
jgi:hypothetical protein